MPQIKAVNIAKEERKRRKNRRCSVKTRRKNRERKPAALQKLARIAVPISIQGVVSATLNLIDNLMVGFLGEADLAAVGIASQIYFIHYLILYGFTSGTATFMAQFYGAKDYKNIRKVVGFSIVVAFCVAVVFLSRHFSSLTIFWESIPMIRVS